MSGIAIGPCCLMTSAGDVSGIIAGAPSMEALRDLDARLPTPNSLRRAGEESKLAVLVAFEALRAASVSVSERVGVYIGLQQVSLDYCSSFIDASYREGPRFSSPMLFSESVANNAAAHLSLTFGLKGVVQTFMGCRPAGIQAVMAAREDVESGMVDTGLVVVLGHSNRLSSDAYNAVHSPYARLKRPPEIRSFKGAAALLVRRVSAGEPESAAGLVYTGVRCFGRSPQRQAEAVRSLWREYRAASARPARIIVSTFCLARSRGLEAIRNALGEEAQGIDSDTNLQWESFALGPILELLTDSVRSPAPSPRAVICLSEEGTAGLLALDRALI